MHRSLLQLLAPLIIAITRVEVTCWEQHWSAAETKWETFAGAGLPSSFCCQPVTGLPSSFCWRWSPLVLPASCPQSKSRSQSHADVQLRLSRSSQAEAWKEGSRRKNYKKTKSTYYDAMFQKIQSHSHGKPNGNPNFMPSWTSTLFILSFKKKPLSKTLVGCGPIKGDEVELGSAFKSARIGDDSTVVGRQPVHLPTVQLVDTGKATQIGQVCLHTAPPGSDYHTNPHHTKLHHIILSYQNKPTHLTRFPCKPLSLHVSYM